MTPETETLRAMFDNWSPSYSGIPATEEIGLVQAGLRALTLLAASEQARQRAEDENAGLRHMLGEQSGLGRSELDVLVPYHINEAKRLAALAGEKK